MAKMLENLRWKPLWTSHIGCLKGCIDHLGLNLSLPWLFGATGHAFIINMHEVVCPSGPTAWNFKRFLELGRNLGYEIEGIHIFKDEKGFKDKQKQSWEMIKAAIDADLPCYGWEMKVPEFYTIHGYDDVGYFYSGAGCDDGEGPKAWKEVGSTELGWLAMFTLKPCKPADVKKQVKDAFEFALEFSKNQNKYLYTPYESGLEAYDNWIDILERDASLSIGTPYNAAVWAECREFAAKFLIEAKEKIGKGFEKLFDDAIAHYKIVADHLEKVRETFPFCEMKPEYLKDKSRKSVSIEHLKEAKRAEEYCLILLKKIYKDM